MSVKTASRLLFSVIIFFQIVSCATYHTNAPVSDINVHRVGKVMVHHVQPGETLYSVAWRYEMDYRDLARINGLTPPYAIHAGQDLRLSGPAIKSAVIKSEKRQVKTTTRQPISVTAEPAGPVTQWKWPAKGSIVNRFSSNNKGVNITGVYDEPIIAVAKGKVVYEGDGIRGYGNLIIIKHNEQYLTAYAHLSSVLVKEGEWVTAGQKIGQMGTDTAGRIILHFELRRNGRPVNPSSVIRYN